MNSTCPDLDEDKKTKAALYRMCCERMYHTQSVSWHSFRTSCPHTSPSIELYKVGILLLKRHVKTRYYNTSIAKSGLVCSLSTICVIYWIHPIQLSCRILHKCYKTIILSPNAKALLIFIAKWRRSFKLIFISLILLLSAMYKTNREANRRRHESSRIPATYALCNTMRCFSITFLSFTHHMFNVDVPHTSLRIRTLYISFLMCLFIRFERMLLIALHLLSFLVVKL